MTSTTKFYPRRLVQMTGKPTIVAKLKTLRQSYEGIGGQPEDLMAFGLLLADVCDALGLNKIQRFAVLGGRGDAGGPARPAQAPQPALAAVPTGRGSF